MNAMSSPANVYQDARICSEQPRKDAGDRGRVAVLLPSALTESFEITLARVLDLHKADVPMRILYCDGAVKGCVANPFEIESACRHCRQVRDTALAEILPNFKGISLDSCYANVQRDRDDLPMETNKELQGGVESTILTFYRRDVGRLSKSSPRGMLYRSLSTRYMRHSRFVYQAITNLLQRGDIARIEFFNGRIVPTRAVMHAAREASINFAVIEVSGGERELFILENESVHDLQYNQRSLKEFIDSGSVDAKLGANFFESRRKGLTTDARSFIQRQKLGALRLEDKRPILAIFTSSADELQVAGDQWFTPASIDPAPFILQIADAVGDGYRVIVRMHPNQAGDRTGAASEMQQLLSRHPRIELIKPNDVQSTYELIDAAKAVLAFGSTVGLEATFWGKPSILCGRAVWDQLDIAYRAESSGEVKLLLSKDLSARSKNDAIAAGSYYMAGRGEKGSLSWQPKGTIGFAVSGRSFLPQKRAAVGYWLTRVIDKALRIA